MNVARWLVGLKSVRNNYDVNKSRIIPFIVLNVVLLLGACSSDASADIDVPLTPPEAGYATYQLPLDDYIAGDVYVDITDYAESLHTVNCMQEKGYDYSFPRIDISTFTKPATSSPSGRKILTTQIAEQFGYHLDNTHHTDIKLASEAIEHRDFTEQEDDDLSACIKKLRAEVTKGTSTSVHLAASLANQALTDATKHKDVKNAAKKWQECMKDAGIPDLPDDPELGMPSESISSKYLADINDTAKPEEIKIAVKDATCRDDSGYAEALYNAEWEEQRKTLAKNADRLAGNKDILAKEINTAKELIAKYGN